MRLGIINIERGVAPCGGYTSGMEMIRRAVLMGLVVGVVGVVVLFLSNPFDSKPTPSMSGDFTPVAPTLIPADGIATDHGLGAADAPVVLTVWTDYQCPICGAMFAGYVDSSVLGAFDPADNNGFDRVHSALPSTDPARMVGFFQREFDRRGLTQAFVAGIPPFGAALLDQLSYAPQACQAGEGVDASGKLVWSGGKPARYVYVLEAGSDNPGIPPNFDLPAGTVWRVDVPHDGQPLASGLAYGAVPSGATQRFPASAPPAPLVAGHVYTLYVLYDVALPLARCTFSAP